jgi:TPR repeat protein
MRHLMTSLVLLATLLTPTRADIEAGRAAYKQGDYAAALREWRPLAEQDHLEAQYHLGVMYLMGQGVSQSTAEADKWLRKAAWEGHALAQDCLGVGRGMGHKALGRLRKVAKQGDPVAQYYLARRLGALELGESPHSAKWYRAAAEQELPAAEFRLGQLHLTGEGVPRDREQAEDWLLRAARHGVVEAYFVLGDLYAGSNLAYDAVKSAQWFRKAADEGDTFAQLLLGILYSEGRGVPQDHVQAYMWVRVAQLNEAGTGNEFASMAQAVLGMIAEYMTDEDVVEADAWAREWKPPEPE